MNEYMDKLMKNETGLLTAVQSADWMPLDD